MDVWISEKWINGEGRQRKVKENEKRKEKNKVQKDRAET